MESNIGKYKFWLFAFSKVEYGNRQYKLKFWNMYWRKSETRNILAPLFTAERRMWKRYPTSIYINNFFSFVTLENGKQKFKLIINLSIYVFTFGNVEILIRIYTKYQIQKSKGRVFIFHIFNVDEIWFNLKHLEDFGRSVKYNP